MISENTRNIKNSKIRAMFQMALQYENPVNLTIGEPDFLVADNIAAAACKAILEGKTKYSENAGLLRLREKISQYLKDEIRVAYDPIKEITVTTGAMGGLFQSLKTILNPGDQVIVIEPCWTNYSGQIMMCEGVPIGACAEMNGDFSIDINSIRDSITDRTKAIVLNSPCNPTGNIIEKEKLLEVAKLAKANDLLVISDEVYKHICYGETEFTSIASLPGMKERTVVIDSFSKSHAMTGFRIGYVAGPEELIANVTKLQENITACVSMPSQYAAIAALDGDNTYVNEMVRKYKIRRDYLISALNDIPLITCNAPHGTFYAFVKIKQTGMSSEEFAINLLKAKQVVVVPGTAFGGKGEGYIRISFATSMDNLKTGMERIKDFIACR